MPGMDGFAVCRQLKEAEATRAIPVLFVTAKDDTGSLLRGFRCGAVDYISKPFQADEVLVRVDPRALDVDPVVQCRRGSCSC
jgi:DNA-binding response OmpR family regulator